MILEAGWFTWRGGLRPLERHEFADVQLRSGAVLRSMDCGSLDWLHRNGPNDIVAYRRCVPVLNKRTVIDDLSRGIHFTITQAAALIESQRATIEGVRVAVGGFIGPTGGDLAAAVDLISLRCATAENDAALLRGRVTALEAERALALRALGLALNSGRQADVRGAIATFQALSRSTEKNDGQ